MPCRTTPVDLRPAHDLPFAVDAIPPAADAAKSGDIHCADAVGAEGVRPQTGQEPEAGRDSRGRDRSGWCWKFQQASPALLMPLIGYSRHRLGGVKTWLTVDGIGGAAVAAAIVVPPYVAPRHAVVIDCIGAIGAHIPVGILKVLVLAANVRCAVPAKSPTLLKALQENPAKDALP